MLSKIQDGDRAYFFGPPLKPNETVTFELLTTCFHEKTDFRIFTNFLANQIILTKKPKSNKTCSYYSWTREIVWWAQLST